MKRKTAFVFLCKMHEFFFNKCFNYAKFVMLINFSHFKFLK